MSATGSLGARRRASRLAAVQTLYQMELAEKPVDVALAEFESHRAAEDAADSERTTPQEMDTEFFTEIVRGVDTRQATLDPAIDAAIAKDRRIDRVEVLIRLILRAGAYELLARPDIDAPLTINEYVAIAKAFFAGAEPSFVNGVLDRMAHAPAAEGGAEGTPDDGTDAPQE
jgi:N utilization substance protein B